MIMVEVRDNEEKKADRANDQSNAPEAFFERREPQWQSV
jgi:hypothetical protein